MAVVIAVGAPYTTMLLRGTEFLPSSWNAFQTRSQKIIMQRLEIPTISYGAGVSCDGQGLVAHDILGMFDRFTPRFAKKYASLNDRILRAFEEYIQEVGEQSFPTDEHAFHIRESELRKLLGKPLNGDQEKGGEPTR